MLASLVVIAANEMTKQVQIKSPPKKKGFQWLDLFGRKAYAMVSLQKTISNCEELLAKYSFVNLDSVSEFSSKLPEEYRDQFNSFVSEGHLVKKTSLQAATDTVDIAACLVAIAIAMWQSLGCNPEALIKN